jgi:hypothetical protein
MRTLDDGQRRAAHVIRLGVLTLGFCLLGFADLIQAGGQNTATQSHVVGVKSDPSGAMIWQKGGRDYTCANTLTPGTVELTFHGDNDVQRLQVRRFGYSAKNLDVKPTDQEVGAVLLGRPASKSFLVADDAAPDFKQLNAAVKKEFEETLLTDQNAFRCAPFDLDFIQLTKDKETGAAELSVALKLDRSFGGPAFRLASHAPNTPERHQKMSQVALENGVAEILGRFHRLAAKFPDLKVITVLCSYATTDAVLDTQFSSFVQTVTRTANPLLDGHTGLATEVFVGTAKVDVVKDQAAEKTISFSMPTAQIPDTLDKKAITDAVLAVGKIILP